MSHTSEKTHEAETHALRWEEVERLCALTVAAYQTADPTAAADLDARDEDDEDQDPDPYRDLVEVWRGAAGNVAYWNAINQGRSTTDAYRALRAAQERIDPTADLRPKWAR